MATKKSKPKKLTMTQVQIKELGDRLTAACYLFAGKDRDQITLINTELRKLWNTHAHQIKALEEAICPRVAARLTALEKTLNVEQIRRIKPDGWPYKGNEGSPMLPDDTLKVLTEALEAAAVRVLDYTGNKDHTHLGAVKITLTSFGVNHHAARHSGRV